MWKLIIEQSEVTDYGYSRSEKVEFESEDISKLTRIIDYFSTMSNKQTKYIIKKAEEKDDE